MGQARDEEFTHTSSTYVSSNRCLFLAFVPLYILTPAIDNSFEDVSITYRLLL